MFYGDKITYNFVVGVVVIVVSMFFVYMPCSRHNHHHHHHWRHNISNMLILPFRAYFVRKFINCICCCCWVLWFWFCFALALVVDAGLCRCTFFILLSLFSVFKCICTFCNTNPYHWNCDRKEETNVTYAYRNRIKEQKKKFYSSFCLAYFLTVSHCG